MVDCWGMYYDRPLYYDRAGAPVRSAEDWQRLRFDPTYRRVARTKVTDAADPAVSFDVSTVWIGMDHSFGNGPPLIFETMVFAEGSSEDEHFARYSTEAQSRDGHTTMVIDVASQLTDPIVMDVEGFAVANALAKANPPVKIFLSHTTR